MTNNLISCGVNAIDRTVAIAPNESDKFILYSVPKFSQDGIAIAIHTAQMLHICYFYYCCSCWHPKFVIRLIVTIRQVCIQKCSLNHFIEDSSGEVIHIKFYKGFKYFRS